MGDKVTVKIIGADFERRRLSLSIRALSEPAAPAEGEKIVEEAPVEIPAAEEAPAEEALAEEAPAVEETPAEEAPAEEAPAAE